MIKNTFDSAANLGSSNQRPNPTRALANEGIFGECQEFAAKSEVYYVTRRLSIVTHDRNPYDLKQRNIYHHQYEC